MSAFFKRFFLLLFRVELTIEYISERGYIQFSLRCVL
jgi:hypothetical protein